MTLIDAVGPNIFKKLGRKPTVWEKNLDRVLEPLKNDERLLIPTGLCGDSFDVAVFEPRDRGSAQAQRLFRRWYYPTPMLGAEPLVLSEIDLPKIDIFQNGGQY